MKKKHFKVAVTGITIIRFGAIEVISLNQEKRGCFSPFSLWFRLFSPRIKLGSYNPEGSINFWLILGQTRKISSAL